jgi:hypothetical protein
MGRGFQPARIPNGEAPSVLAIIATAAQTFKRSSLVKQTAAGTISERTAVGDKVTGVALQDAFSGYGSNAANSPTVITGQNLGETSVAIADAVSVFSCRGVNGGTDPVTPVQANIGVSYGVAKTGGGDWVLDTANTTNLVCEVVDIDADAKIFFVKFNVAFRDYI